MPGLKARFKPQFPARVQGTNGDTVTKAGGVYTFGPSYGSLTAATSLTSEQRTDRFLRYYDSSGNSYGKVSLDLALRLGDVSLKEPCIAGTTANITLSGLQTIDGVVLVAGDRVLVKDQTDATENGIYIAASGAWSRAADFDGDDDVVSGTMVMVSLGSTNFGSVYRVANDDPISVGVTGIVFSVLNVRNQEGLRVTPDPVFDFAGITIFGCAGPGQAIHNFDCEAKYDEDTDGDTGATVFGTDRIYIPAQDAVCDYTNGDDATGTGSMTAPYKTVRKASENSGRIVWIKPCQSREILDLKKSVTLNNRPLKFIPLEGPGTVSFIGERGQEADEMTWLLGTGCWEATPSPTATLLAAHWFTQSGEERQLPFYDSLAHLQSNTTFGIFQDSGTKKISIKLGGLSVEDYKTDIDLIYLSVNDHYIKGLTSYWEDIEFHGGSQLIVDFEGTDRPTFYGKRLIIRNSTNKGLVSVGCRSYLQECEIVNNSSDGVSHDLGTDATTDAEFVEIDCVMTGNGAISTADGIGIPSITRNHQGSTTHNGSIGLRINGVYGGGWGQGIADTGATSKRWMIGTICTSPYYWDDLAAINPMEALEQEGYCWLDTIAAGGLGSQYGMLVQSAASDTSIKVYNCAFQGETADTETGGVPLTPYLPSAP